MPHPLRLAILERAAEPRSATEIATLLRQPRQRVNYHVRRLHAAGFLQRAGRRRRRGLTSSAPSPRRGATSLRRGAIPSPGAARRELGRAEARKEDS